MFIAFLNNSQKLEIAQVSINRWMDKQIVVYLYSGPTTQQLKMTTSETHHNTDESQHIMQSKRNQT